MKLYLVQHGEASSKDVDPERPLTDHGRSDVLRLGRFLQTTGIGVQRVVHSGKLRARQTAELLAQSMAPSVEPETNGLLNPNDSPRAFDWQSESWDRDTLIVGHLPFMARMVSELIIGDENRPFTAFLPGSMVCLEGDHQNGWHLNWMIRPELLMPVSTPADVELTEA